MSAKKIAHVHETKSEPYITLYSLRFKTTVDQKKAATWLSKSDKWEKNPDGVYDEKDEDFEEEEEEESEEEDEE